MTSPTGYIVRWTSAYGRALAAWRDTRTEAAILAAWLRRCGFEVSVEQVEGEGI